MKARRWLVVAAACLLLPSVAHAQKKKPKHAPAPAPAPAPANGGEIELDQPAPAPAAPTDTTATPAPTDTGATPAPTDTGAGAPGGAAGGGICEIDPSACPKQEDIAKAAHRTVNAEIYAVEQIYALRYHRVELNPYWGLSLNDQFVSHDGPGLAANFYITNVLAIGVNGIWYGGLNSEADFNFQNRRAARVAVPLNEYQWGGNLNFTYVPVYGKFAGFNQFIFSYDAYLLGGLGAISTRPIPVIDPDNRNFQFKPKLDFDLGLGLRIFFSRWFAVTMEVRDYIYSEQLEALTIGTAPSNTTSGGAPNPGSPQDPGTWFGQNRLTNNVMAQVGVSIFLPFGWEYRLPK
jgi:outer membrane beta-barrel protein